jgi:Mrp family chromosome partitioning ATPase/capsular polysaccharide biosynthesis protein
VNRIQAREPAASADLRDLISPVWRRRWLVLVIVIVSTVATYMASDAGEEQFKSTTQVFVSDSQISSLVSGSGVAGTDRSTQDQATLLLSRAVTDAVRTRLKLTESPASLVGSVTATPSTGSNFVSVTAVRGSGAEAAAVANAYVQEFIRYRTAQLGSEAKDAIARVRGQLAQLPAATSASDQRAALKDALQQLEAARAVTPVHSRQTNLAAAPAQPFSPRPKRDAFFAFAISVVLALALAFGLERFDRRIKRFQEVSDLYGAPLLATIPHTTGLTTEGKAAVVPLLQESFRELRTHLQLAFLDNAVSHLVVTSAFSGEGKSTVVRNLALTYREWGQCVVVIEADLRRPDLPRLFGVKSRSPGLTGVLTGEISLDEALIEIECDVTSLEYLQRITSAESNVTPSTRDPKVGVTASGLALLPSGPAPPNPQAVLAAEKPQRIIDDLKQRFDIVLIDTPPALVVTDAMPLIARADGVVVVSRVGMTERSSARRLMSTLQLDPNVQVLGVVANDLAREPGRGYGCGYGTYDASNGSSA